MGTFVVALLLALVVCFTLATVQVLRERRIMATNASVLLRRRSSPGMPRPRWLRTRASGSPS